MEPFDSLDRLERLRVLDPAVRWLRSTVQHYLRSPEVRDALHGTWLGHPLHPMLTDVTIGCWTAAGLLDLVPGTGPAAGTLVSAGMVAAVPTAVTGLTDWTELNAPESRTGLVHATANTAALGIYAASLWARLRGRRGRAKLLRLAGLGAVTVGGLIGGHLSYRRAAGVNHNADALDTGRTEWTDVAAVSDLPDGEPVQRQLAGVPVLLFRRAERMYAIVDRCSHLSGPLHEGEVTGGDDPCVVCPWHGSTFRLRDGAVVHGPAVAPQPVVHTQVVGDRVQVRLGG